MPTKSSGSHAGGHLMSLVASALLVEHVTTFLPSFRELSHLAGNLFTGVTGVSLPDQVSGMLLISLVLMAVWGVGFHFYHA
ncbi:hypothetical protein [Haloarcula sediminis]|uniref:hypothetical protein n=1 Tax=Haloarcula sediminis TaxID=3111777 RepID=UPI002D79AD7D|nr:hypothetical protein [Haloarcula sp. CK38]